MPWRRNRSPGAALLDHTQSWRSLYTSGIAGDGLARRIAAQPDGSVALAAGIFCLTELAAGVRTPASSRLGLEQLPDHPGAMMAARTAAIQLGYLLGAVIGSAVIPGAGYGTLGVVLALGIGVSALLILRVDDPLAATTGPTGRK